MGTIQERLRPKEGDPTRSRSGAQTNLRAHGSESRYESVVSPSEEPPFRSRTGIARVKKPKGSPWEK